MEIPAALQGRIEDWAGMSRWERAELGRALRRLGLSYGEIMDHVDVKKSTLATWCRDILLTEDQQQAILARTGSRKGIPIDTQWRRHAEIESIRLAGRLEAVELLSKPDWLAGVILYWCEGAKTPNHLKLANSDPVALIAFIGWVRRYLDADAEFAVQLHLHEGNDDAVSQAWWSERLNLPGARFYKTFIKPAGTGHRKNHLAHGVACVRMARASNSWHRVMAWIEVVRQRLDDVGEL